MVVGLTSTVYVCMLSTTSVPYNRYIILLHSNTISVLPASLHMSLFVNVVCIFLLFSKYVYPSGALEFILDFLVVFFLFMLSNCMSSHCLVPCCDACYDSSIKTMFVSSYFHLFCRESGALFTYVVCIYLCILVCNVIPISDDGSVIWQHHDRCP
jgi:hypothetical protein